MPDTIITCRYIPEESSLQTNIASLLESSQHVPIPPTHPPKAAFPILPTHLPVPRGSWLRHAQPLYQALFGFHVFGLGFMTSMVRASRRPVCAALYSCNTS